mmetsp:Transcript_79104/g.223892  ORF Transcript_79104/g.223892 Transcript_79104/m.223892 type:complete len:256 (-) Transcript_79104:153-920(-)
MWLMAAHTAVTTNVLSHESSSTTQAKMAGTTPRVKGMRHWREASTAAWILPDPRRRVLMPNVTTAGSSMSCRLLRSPAPAARSSAPLETLTPFTSRSRTTTQSCPRAPCTSSTSAELLRRTLRRCLWNVPGPLPSQQRVRRYEMNISGSRLSRTSQSPRRMRPTQARAKRHAYAISPTTRNQSSTPASAAPPRPAMSAPSSRTSLRKALVANAATTAVATRKEQALYTLTTRSSRADCSVAAVRPVLACSSSKCC